MVSSSSSIYHLDPFIQDNIIRIGGRLTKSDLPDGTKYPILLPQKSHITTLVIRDVHQQLAHAGRNPVISKLRERFWIVAINSAVRRMIYNCITCRRLRKPFLEPKMADLPADRMIQAPPFTYCGLDLFGPFYIKEGRKELKRYGVLFTCLASRAVHLESTNTMDTDSFINSLRRFISRRGPVKEIRCDNGSNFVGAERELREAIKELDHDQITLKCLFLQIKWVFDLPAASHMGGIWERQIRSIRKVLSSLFRNHGTCLDDKSFCTLLCEVEAIINSRPLTPASDNTDDYEPLTPNHILTMKTSMLPPPGLFERHDMYLRKRWRRVQHLAGLFWTRWRNEYILTLQPRQKWNRPQRNLQQGDVVILRYDSSPRFKRPIARVLSTNPDSKGDVRSVKLKTQTTELHRPVHKVVLILAVNDQ